MKSSTPKRVAYVLPHAQLGGAEIATLRVMEAHDQSRYVPVGLLFEDGPAARHLDDVGIEHAIAPLRPRFSSGGERHAARVWLEQQITNQRIDLQHSVMAWTQALAAPAARRAGVPAVWFQHNRATWRSGIEVWATLSACKIVFANSRFTQAAQQRLNIRRRPIELVYPPTMVNDAGEADSFRKAIGVAQDVVLVAVCGRLLHAKGQDIALSALARASVNLHVALVGASAFGLEPDYPAQLESMVEQYDLGHRVHFVGFQEDMSSVYAAADIVLHTSRLRETYGLVVAEAKQFGCAIVATNRGAIPELIQDGKNGMLFDPDDPAFLAQILTRLAADGDLRTRLGTAARRETAITPSHAAQQIEQAYDRVLRS